MDVTVLYEDLDVVAVAKAPGQVVVPARDEDPEGCLRRVVERARSEALWVVHRIDRDTSGVVVFARNAAAHRALSLAFEHREVEKTYLALTRGAPPAERGTINYALHAARKGKMRPAMKHETDALPSVTDYAVLRRWRAPIGEVCLVEVRPRTGRQHQIRVHLRAVEAPLLVDPVYGRAAAVTAAELGFGERPGEGVAFGRLSLHALAVEFPAPADQRRVRVEAPLAEDLAALVARLDAPGARY